MWRSAVQVCLGLHIAAWAMCLQAQNESLGLQSPPGQCAYRLKMRAWDVSILGGLAQLARAPALQAGGQRFESVILHQWCERDRRSQSRARHEEGVRDTAIFDIL